MAAAEDFMDAYKLMVRKKSYKTAAFNLHQVTERLYDCFLLVHTNYAPATHDLRTLRSMSESRSEALRDIWPEDTKLARRCFQLLRRAYVEARYSKHYKILEEELGFLNTHISKLTASIIHSCEQKIMELSHLEESDKYD